MRRIENELELPDEITVRYDPGSRAYHISQEAVEDVVDHVFLYAEEAKKIAEWILKKEQGNG